MSTQDLAKVKSDLKTNLDKFNEDQRVFTRDLKTYSTEYLKNSEIKTVRIYD